MGESESGLQVQFMRLPISLPCPIKVRAGTPDVLDEHGEPLPDEERTEYCAVDAFWMLGAAVVCDVHLRVSCTLLEIDYDDMLAEAATNPAYDAPASEVIEHWRKSEAVPWTERFRYPQDGVFPTPGDAA